MDRARKKIEGKLGRRLYDCVWSRVVRDSEDFEDVDNPDQVQELREVAEDLQQFAEQVEQELETRPATKPRRSMDRPRFLDEDRSDLHAILMADSFYVDSDSRAALRALSEYAALKANENPWVVEFRASALNGGYLSIEQAIDLLSSHAARFLPLEQMQNFDVPLAGHKVSLLGPYREVDREGGFDHFVSLSVDPPGISLRLRYTNLVDTSDDVEDLGRCHVEGGEAIAPYKINLPPEEVSGTAPENENAELGPGSKPIGPVLISNFDTVDRPANIWPGSLVDEIYVLAQWLSESFMWPSRKTRSTVDTRRTAGTWWNVDSVALFVLTGIAPLMHPIKVELARAEGGKDVPSRVSFEILPWIPYESVAESYKAVRRELGVKLRNQGERKFDVVAFALQRSKSYDPETLDFRKLRESWNTEFPEKKFKDTNSFRTSFDRGLQAVEKRYYL